MGHRCDVCGYPAMSTPPENHAICPCCGTEFWTDDFDKSVEQLRWEWIQVGAPWFSQRVPMPANWSAINQLLKANLIPFSMRASESANPPLPMNKADLNYSLAA